MIFDKLSKSPKSTLFVRYQKTEIQAHQLGKKFRNEWIFRNVNADFVSGQVYAFTGSNGSGKSTLLQVLSGFVPTNEGQIIYTIDNQPFDSDNIHQQIAIAAPYLELIEEFTLAESIDFHQKFKPLKGSIEEFIDFVELPKARNKAIKFFSSGMKQRLKLGLAFWSNSPILLLDEPTSNLDAQAIRWYLDNVQNHSIDRLTIIASNQPNEYEWTKAQVWEMAKLK
jgi:ABC-type multidrug transport system ATPase subunit